MRTQADAAVAACAAVAPGGSGGVTQCDTLGAIALTALLDPGGQFGLDDVVRSGRVQLPRASGLLENTVALRGKGRLLRKRRTSERQTPKRARR